MQKKILKEMEDRIDRLPPSDRRLLYKRAQKIKQMQKDNVERSSRACTARRSRHWRDWMEKEEDTPGSRSRVQRRSLREIAAEILLADSLSDESDSMAPATESGMASGTVISVLPDGCIVGSDGGEIRCTWAGRAEAQTIAPGDEILYERLSADEGRFGTIQPRRSILARPEPLRGRVPKVIAANIDIVVIVVSVLSPRLRPRLIDRILVATHHGGATPILCVNKIDLLSSSEDRESLERDLAPYRDAGVPIFPVSAETGAGLAELNEAVRDRLCVLAGHSGVGKSSILNAMAPSLNLRTGQLSRGSSRGRHTTTSSTLIALPGGAKIIDTPGIRAFGLWKIGREELASHFPEFGALACSCRFSNCLHDREPECAVRDAAERNAIARFRYATYLRILETLRE